MPLQAPSKRALHTVMLCAHAACIGIASSNLLLGSSAKVRPVVLLVVAVSASLSGTLASLLEWILGLADHRKEQRPASVWDSELSRAFVLFSTTMLAFVIGCNVAYLYRYGNTNPYDADITGMARSNRIAEWAICDILSLVSSVFSVVMLGLSYRLALH